jgi:hypothetical protein
LPQTQQFTIDGITYKRLEDMPPDVKKKWDSLSRFFGGAFGNAEDAFPQKPGTMTFQIERTIEGDVLRPLKGASETIVTANAQSSTRWTVPMRPQEIRQIDRSKPSAALCRLNAAMSWGILAWVLMGMFSLLYSDFVPSQLTVKMTEILASVVGVSYGVFSVGVRGFGWNSRRPELVAYSRENPAMAKPYIRGPFMALIFFMFAWLSFAAALPYALNLVVGREGTMSVTIGGWEDWSYSFKSGTSCARPTLQDVPFFMLGRRALCAPQGRGKNSFPKGTKMILMGRVSALGISPTRFQVLESQR